MINKILNAGAGDTRIRNSKNLGFNLDIEYFPNIDTVANLERLPFNDNTFHTTFCSHVLEHCYNPFQALKELKRVSSYQVIIIVPHTLDHYSNDHIYSWTYVSFNNLLSKVFPHYYIHGSFTRLEKNLNITGRLKLLKRLFYLSVINYLRIPVEHIAICNVG